MYCDANEKVFVLSCDNVESEETVVENKLSFEVEEVLTMANAIEWDDGGMWRRLNLSSHQFHMLVYRPYVGSLCGVRNPQGRGQVRPTHVWLRKGSLRLNTSPNIVHVCS